LSNLSGSFSNLLTSLLVLQIVTVFQHREQR
jgi:hypothetical protein